MDSSLDGGRPPGSRSSARKSPAHRWIELSAKLLADRDLLGCKRLVERALDSSPLVPGADEILAVANVLLASSSSPPDPYAILQLPPLAPSVEVRLSYRRLSLLLDPSRNRHPGADAALKLISESYDAITKHTPPTSTPLNSTINRDSSCATFWTACPSCFHVHLFPLIYLDKILRCPNPDCARPFTSSQVPVPPPIVPGTDMYYCSWGFVPLGFLNSAADITKGCKTFRPIYHPCQASANNNMPPGSDPGGRDAASNKSRSSEGELPVVIRPRKTTARKKVTTSGPKKKFSSTSSVGDSGGGDAEPQDQDWNHGANVVGRLKGININEEVHGPDGGSRSGGRMGNSTLGGGVADLGSFHLDVDASVDILGNLQALPFLKDDAMPGRMM